MDMSVEPKSRRWVASSPRHVWITLGILAGLVSVAGTAISDTAPQPPHTIDYAVTIDATALEPPTRWYVPGVTPIIWSMDPDTSEAYKTTEPRVVGLKPGHYKFGTFTFDFPFMLTLEGVLNFSPSLDQCVSGRGTRTLTVRCSRTQPFSGEPDY